MSNIPNPISQRGWELVRDRIGLILANELLTQSQIDYDDQLFELPNVFVERFVPFNHEEMPAVNVMLAEGNYDQEFQDSQDATWVYYIDAYTTAKSSDGQRGDQLAAFRIQRLMGVIQAIFMDTRHKRLLFEPGFISNRSVKKIMMADPSKAMEATSSIMARLTLEVRVFDCVEVVSSRTLEEYAARVQLYNTGFGYLWSGSPSFTPPADCNPSEINVNGVFIKSVPSGEEFNIAVVNSEGQAVGEVYGNTVIVPVSSDADFDISINGASYLSGVSSDVDISVLDSAGGSVGSENAGGDIEISDATMTVNGDVIAGVLAEGSKAIEIVDQEGNILSLTQITNTLSLFRASFTIPESTTMSVIQAKTLDSFRNGTPMGYNIAGDSNRAGSAYVPNMFDYYRQLFRQNNMDVYLNAASAQRAIDWADPSNNTQASLNRAVSQALGTDGEDTILEFGYGINDYNRVTTGDITLAEMKQELVDAINAYLAQKPRAHILLVAPTRTAEPKTTDLNTVYQEISDENGWELVSGYEATKSVFVDAVVGASQTAYYVETTHINDNGARRLVNYIASYIFHPEIQWAFTLPEYDPIEAETALVNEAVIETGQWNFVGLPQSDPSWRRLEPITVRPLSIWTIQHQGESRDIFWFDSIGTATRVVLPDLVGDETNWQIEAPSDAVELRINISRLGTSYDALGDTPIAKNAVPILTYDMPQSKINLGLPIRFNT